MKIDKRDYYPNILGASCDPDADTGMVDSLAESPAESPYVAKLSTPQPEADPTLDHTEPNLEMPHKDEKDAVSIFSNILSWILVPLLVPVYATILIMNLSLLSVLPFSTKLIFTLVVLLFTTVLPMILVIILKKLGYVDDLGLNGRKERLIPYIITILSFMGVAYFFHTKHAPLWMSLFYVGGALAGFINMIINFKWKISAHAAAMAGLVALLVIINGDGMPHPYMIWWISATILLSGMLGSARVWLGRHTVMQVICGYAVGFLSVFIPEFLITL